MVVLEREEKEEVDIETGQKTMEESLALCCCKAQ